VCPWNRHAQKADVEEPIDPPELAPLMGLTESEFRRRFGRTPLKRAGRNGLLRNAAIALGNTRSPEAVKPLTKGLNDESWLVRLHSAWALRQIDSECARRVLARRLARETDGRVRAEITAPL
jgi:epoxyqueuosine reductase